MSIIINIHGIKSVISSLPSSEAGYDEIPVSIVKQLGNYYAEPLTHLINKSISQGLFPEEKKLAKSLPIITDQYQVYHFFLKI